MKLPTMAAPCHFSVKVHRLMCLELVKYIDRISQIFLAIESARPRCRTGLQALCTLHVYMGRANLLIQHCSESSKLYLAITGDKIVLRCEKIRDKLKLCLSQIQDMVPPLLAEQISKIVDDLKIVTFSVESSEDEAGKVVLHLLRQEIAASNYINKFELEALQVAALRLHLTSHLAILIEKRAITKLLEKIQDTDPGKIEVLNYFIYLLKKYGKTIGVQVKERISSKPEKYINQCIEPVPNAAKSRDEDRDDTFYILEPPEEFKCPLSRRLMYNPVTIASGQTFEKLWIEKWFNEGHETCPKTQKKLHDLSMTQNCTLKELISRWSAERGIVIHAPPSQPNSANLRSQKSSCSSSIASLNSSINCLRFQTSNVSYCSSDTNNTLCELDADIGFDLSQMNSSHRFQSLEFEGRGTSFSFLIQLATLPWESQCKAVEDVKEQLRDNPDSLLMISTSCIKPLINFLKNAHELRDSGAQKNGAELLLAFLKECRNEIPPLHEEVIYTLSSLLDSEAAEAVLAIFEVLSSQEYYKAEVLASFVLPSILGILGNETRNCHLCALKLLCNLSAEPCIGQHMVYLDYISKFAPFWSDRILSGYCIKIIKNLCNVEEALASIAGNDPCIASIAELLESVTEEEQELATDVLYSLCHQNKQFCELVRNENIVSSLFTISVNGSARGRLIALELLLLL